MVTLSNRDTCSDISKKEKRLSELFREHLDSEYKNLGLRIIKPKKYTWWQFLLHGWFASYEVWDVTARSHELLATMGGVTHHIDWTEAGMKKKPEEVVKEEKENKDFNTEFYQKHPELAANFFSDHSL